MAALRNLNYSFQTKKGFDCKLELFTLIFLFHLIPVQPLGALFGFRRAPPERKRQLLSWELSLATAERPNFTLLTRAPLSFFAIHEKVRSASLRKKKRSVPARESVTCLVLFRSTCICACLPACLSAPFHLSALSTIARVWLPSGQISRKFH